MMHLIVGLSLVLGVIGFGLLAFVIGTGLLGFFSAIPAVYRDVKQTAYEALPLWITRRSEPNEV